MYQLVLRGHQGNYNNPIIIHHSEHSTLKVVNPILNLEVNKTGRLTFTITPNHPHFDKLEKLKSEISVYRDGEWLFTGRILNEEINIYNQKKIECEGILAYLLDTMQFARVFDGGNGPFASTIYEYLEEVMNVHNMSLDNFSNIQSTRHKQFLLKYDDTPHGVGASFPETPRTDYSDTLTNINNTLPKYFGKGYLSAYVDSNYNKCLKYEKLPTSNPYQQIRFGSNLLDMISYNKGEEIVTGIIPLGKIINEDTGLRLSLSEMTDNTVTNYYGSLGIRKFGDVLYKTSAVNKYGYIVKNVILDDCEDEGTLLQASIDYLNYYTIDTSSIEVSAFDLNLLNPDIKPINVAQLITVISEPHNININMIVEKMSIDIASPEKSKITLVNPEQRSSLYNNTLTNKSTKTETVLTTGNTYSDYSYDTSVVGSGDMSDYATRSEVNSAFSYLAGLLEGL